MLGLRAVLDRCADFSEFAGENILGCVTVTPETGVLVLTLAALGANVRWCSDNRFASDDDVVDHLAAEGIPAFARANMTTDEYFASMDRAREFDNDDRIQVIDDGADITRHIAHNDLSYFRRVRGITEQTTCGVEALHELYRDRLLPVASIDINACFTKKYFDNFHGVQESLVRGLMAATGMQLAGKSASIFGYGPVGSGAAAILKSIGCRVSIVEANLLKAVQAHFDGFEVVSASHAVQHSLLCVTATGRDGVISADLIDRAADGVILCNIGHGSAEYDVAHLERQAEPQPVNQFLDMYLLDGDRVIYSCCKGALVNLIAGRGNPPAIMSLTFTLQLLGQRELIRHCDRYGDARVHPLPERLEWECAALNHPDLLANLSNPTNLVYGKDQPDARP